MTVDLRSDTVTRPTPAMLDAMVRAELDDDVLGHDPTVERLERLSAQTTGHEAAILLPSGTMSNQVAIATHTRPGDSILVDDDAHVVFYEGGSPAVMAGVLPRTVPSRDGVIDPSKIAQRFLHRSEHTPGTTLLCLENTHNRAGGSVTPVSVMAECRREADALGIPIHLDGARVFNAAVALGVPVREVASLCDTVNFCLSKGLAAPIGSMLCGSAEFIERARFWRKRMGGGMRQAGVIAACGIVALETMVDRLADDHRRAAALAAAIEGLPDLRPLRPQTNIVMVDTDRPAEEWSSRLEAEGVRCYPIGANRLRMVFHKDVDDDGLDATVRAFRKLADR
jgi:threonine aldolase